MAFHNLQGQIMTDNKGITYIIADSFSVLFPDGNQPSVYSWRDIRSLRIYDGAMAVSTDDGTYNIAVDAFESRKQFLCAKSIASVGCAKYGVDVSCIPELLPEKKLYNDYDISDNAAVVARGVYNVKEIKASLLLLTIGKTAKLLWTVGIVAGVIALALFQIFVGFNSVNWWYLAIGSFFCGVGAVALTYIIMMTISKARYASILKVYSKYEDSVTFAICDEGFSACESDVYNRSGIIRWQMKDTFIETANMYIVLRKGKTILWIPKSLFSDAQLNRINDILTLRISQK